MLADRGLAAMRPFAVESCGHLGKMFWVCLAMPSVLERRGPAETVVARGLLQDQQILLQNEAVMAMQATSLAFGR